MVEKKTDAIDRIAIDHIVKLRDRLVVERLRLFRLKRAIDAYAQTVDSQLLSASRSDGPLARPRSCVAKPIRSEMPNRTPWLREAANDRALRGRTRRGLATRQYRAMSPGLG